MVHYTLYYLSFWHLYLAFGALQNTKKIGGHEWPNVMFYYMNKVEISVPLKGRKILCTL
jgi:hypothetical protein